MSIDWFTVAAQIINFLILVWLLKRFLYRPVLDAMARREARIAARLREAEDKARAAAAERQRYLARQEELRQRVADELAAAKKEAERLQEEMLAAARQEVADRRRAWLAALEAEKSAFLDEAGRLLVRSFEQLSRQALAELADAELEERIGRVFAQRLAALPADDRQALGRGLQAAHGRALVLSRFPLPAEVQRLISDQVRAVWGDEVAVAFDLDQRLLAGVVLTAGGKRIRWDFDHYLAEIRGRLARALEQQLTVGE